jgi:ubiquinone/menaquinone biosynthesis C-methylase UbiE
MEENPSLLAALDIPFSRQDRYMSHSPLAQLQKRLFAWGMAKANEADNQDIKLKACDHHDNLDELKQALLGQLHGRVLEIGPGTGASFAYLQNDIEWIGIEPNPYMHSYLREEAQRQGMQSIELIEGAAENLPLADESVDAVISNYVLCSVSNLPQALQEIHRILKPEGIFVYLEHVAAESGTWNRQVQDLLAPAWKRLFDNCHPNRETPRILHEAGFEPVDAKQFRLSVPVIAPHAAGVVKKGPYQS